MSIGSVLALGAYFVRKALQKLAETEVAEQAARQLETAISNSAAYGLQLDLLMKQAANGPLSPADSERFRSLLERKGAADDIIRLAA